jgi:hypothetical protein
MDHCVLHKAIEDAHVTHGMQFTADTALATQNKEEVWNINQNKIAFLITN